MADEAFASLKRRITFRTYSQYYTGERTVMTVEADESVRFLLQQAKKVEEGSKRRSPCELNSLYLLPQCNSTRQPPLTGTPLADDRHLSRYGVVSGDHFDCVPNPEVFAVLTAAASELGYAHEAMKRTGKDLAGFCPKCGGATSPQDTPVGRWRCCDKPWGEGAGCCGYPALKERHSTNKEIYITALEVRKRLADRNVPLLDGHAHQSEADAEELYESAKEVLSRPTLPALLYRSTFSAPDLTHAPRLAMGDRRAEVLTQAHPSHHPPATKALNKILADRENPDPTKRFSNEMRPALLLLMRAYILELCKLRMQDDNELEGKGETADDSIAKFMRAHQPSESLPWLKTLPPPLKKTGGSGGKKAVAADVKASMEEDYREATKEVQLELLPQAGQRYRLNTKWCLVLRPLDAPASTPVTLKLHAPIDLRVEGVGNGGIGYQVRLSREAGPNDEVQTGVLPSRDGKAPGFDSGGLVWVREDLLCPPPGKVTKANPTPNPKPSRLVIPGSHDLAVAGTTVRFRHLRTHQVVSP